MTYIGIEFGNLIGMNTKQLRMHYHNLLGARYGIKVPEYMKHPPRLKNDLIDRIMEIQTEVATRESIKAWRKKHPVVALHLECPDTDAKEPFFDEFKERGEK